MSKGRLKLEEKFIILLVIIGFLCFGVLGVISYNQISKIVIAQNKDDAMGIATTAALSIDGDVFAAIEECDDDAYKQVYDTLEKYKANNLITYIYAMEKKGDKVCFIVDTDTEEPALFKEEYPLLESMAPAFDGVVCSDDGLTADRWGEYFSAYAPIFNSEGEVVGIVGCDIGVATIQSVLGELRDLIVLLVTLFAVVIIILSIVVSRKMLGRDPYTELSNYEQLIKMGNSLQKRGELSGYSGIMFALKDQKFLKQQVGAKNGELFVKAYAKSIEKRMKRQDYVFSIGNDVFFALVKKEREQLFLDALINREVSIKTRDGVVATQLSSYSGIFQIRDHDTINEVINYTTMALDTARRNDELDVQWFEEDMIEQMVTEKEVINAFRTGLVRHEFVVYYQPKVNLDTNKLCGAEALVRWFRNGKIVPPDSFIPILEKNNLVTELDFYVFEQVCKDIKRWEEDEIEVVKVSSNFSKLHLKNDYFAEELIDVIDKYQIDSSYVEAELTESSGYYDLKALELFVYKMNKANVSVSVDDFGTGYSSLSLLKDLNFDVVKMDKSFFRDIEKGDAVNEKMVENVIRMVQDLQREIICEGIETEHQAQFLKKLRAPIVQGYLYDKPLPHNEFEKRLKNPVYEKKES